MNLLRQIEVGIADGKAAPAYREAEITLHTYCGLNLDRTQTTEGSGERKLQAQAVAMLVSAGNYAERRRLFLTFGGMNVPYSKPDEDAKLQIPGIPKAIYRHPPTLPRDSSASSSNCRNRDLGPLAFPALHPVDLICGWSDALLPTGAHRL